MNLNQITPGTDYAYFPWRGKQEEFRWNRQDGEVWREGRYSVYRIKAIRAYSEREYGKKRDTGYVDVFWLDDEGEFKLDENDNHQIKKIRVRDIATIWEDYEDELDHQTVKKNRAQAEREEADRIRREEWERQSRIREERERIEREERERIREQKELHEKQYIKAIELRYGLPEGSVKADNYGERLIVDKAMVDNDMRVAEQIGHNGEQAISIE